MMETSSSDDLDDAIATQYAIQQSLMDIHKQYCIANTLEANSFFSLPTDHSAHEKIVAAIHAGDEKTLQNLSCRFRTFKEADGRGWIPLHEAAIKSNKNILAITLKASCSSVWEKTTLKGETPLYLAIEYCQLENANFLLNKGCDPNAKNEEGDSPLTAAIRRGSYDIASSLIGSNADVNLRCVNERTALHEAAQLGHKDIVQLLLLAGDDPDPRSSSGRTPLALASQYGHRDIIELLIQKGANVLSQASDCASILFEAATGGNPDVVSLLLKYGADANVPKESGHLPIHGAAYRGHFLALKKLIPATDFGAIKRSGISPVHSAAAGGHPRCIKLLLKSNFDVNFMLHSRVRSNCDDQGRSALYFAVANGDTCSVKLLLEAGAFPNQDPINCLQVALRMGNHELVNMLLRHGANVNYFCRVNTLHFPSALQYTLKDEVMLRMLLNYGYDVKLCFDCHYGNKDHTPEGYKGWSSAVIKDTMFCEVITLNWLRHLSGNVVRALLDYVDHVELCSKLKDVLVEQMLWPEINTILLNTRSLKHLCRLKIRKCMGRLRIRCPIFMTFLPLPDRLKQYVLYKEYDLYGQGILKGTRK
ncbi:ankyrin repeat and SOCS box protein 14 [Lissotriton helveticus]